MAHYFPYDVKLRLLADSRSFLANQKARNAIVEAENLLNPNFQNRACCEKYIFEGHYLFLDVHSFPRATLSENCSLLGTDNARGQISVHIFARNGDYFLFILYTFFQIGRHSSILLAVILVFFVADLCDREQYTVINGVPSENTKVAHGIPQGSVLGPILFALYTSDLPKAVNTATTFLYADDTTMYCVGESVDQVIATLNKALEELALWCKLNSLVPHPKKCEGMILKRNHFIGPLGSLKINQHNIKWCSSSKLLGVTIDNRLTWSKHILELKRGFVNKLNLIKRSRFLPRNSLLDLYFKVILPSVTYALPIWGCCTNKNEFNSLESIHCRAARVIYNLPRDMPSEDVRKTANWDSLFDTYKVIIATLIYNIYNRITPSCLEHIIQRKETKYDLRHQHRVSVQRFETYYMKYSISHRGFIVWNLLEPSAISARDYAKRAKKSHALRNLNFNEESPQMGRPQNDSDFVFY